MKINEEVTMKKNLLNVKKFPLDDCSHNYTFDLKRSTVNYSTHCAIQT